MAGKISGFTSLDGAPIQTTVRIYEAATGILVESLQSAADGWYESIAGNELAVFVLADPPAGYSPICHGPLMPVVVEVDVHSASVVSLMHFDWLGTNKLVSDEIAGNTWTVIGSATVEQGEFKFGSGSLQCQNDGGAKLPYSPYFTFYTFDVTIESWVYIPANIAAKSSGILPILTMGKLSSAASDLGSGFYLKEETGGYSLNLLCYSTSSTSDKHTSSIFPLTTGWHHVAWSRAGTDSHLFVDGVNVGSRAFTISLSNWNSHDTTIGYAVSGSFYGPVRYAGNHSIDDLRVTRGVARYTENFIPRTFPFAYTP